jgi:MFS family permease
MIYFSGVNKRYLFIYSHSQSVSFRERAELGSSITDHSLRVKGSRNSQALVFWSGIIGNVLDHYDVALYVYLAPFIAQVFFADNDPTVALILTYGLMSTSLITRPLGSLLFGKMAINIGAKKTLLITLAGVTVSSFCLGLIPGYASIGSSAPILLALIRMIQGLFASGELSIVALFILEQSKESKRSRASSYYLCSTMGGICLASWAAAWVSQTDNPEYYWRIPFFASALTAIVGFWMRSLLKDLPPDKLTKRNSNTEVILKNKWKIVKIICVSSFSYMTFAVPFIFMNKFIPMITDITDTEMLTHNSFLLMLDILLLPVFGWIAEKFQYYKWMALQSGLIMITIVPLFYILPLSSLWEVTLLRLWIIVIGVAFVAPLNAWFFQLLAGPEKYLIMGFGYSIGTEFLGRNTVAISYSLFYAYNSVIAPACYIALISLLATVALMWRGSESLRGVIKDPDKAIQS